MVADLPTVAFEPERLVHELSKRGLAWADSEAAYRALDDATKSVLGQAYLQTEGTVAEREAQARTNATFRDHIAAVAKSRKAALVARVNYDIWSEFMRMKQTQQATVRAEMNLR